MKRIIIYWMIDLVLIAFLVICAIANRSQAEAQETCSPPSWGVGRESETETEVIVEIDIETETEVETQLETEAVTESEEVCKLQASCETLEIIEETDIQQLETQVSASWDQVEDEFVEDTDVLVNEELVEVIPAIEGKYLDVPMSAELQDYVRAVSAEYGVPFELTMAVIYVESKFIPETISSTDDYGLMQVNKINHEDLKEQFGFTDFLDPYQNIYSGVYILADKIRESGGDFTTALMRYNEGDQGARDRWAVGQFSTQYSEDVLSKYYEYIREG